MKKLTKNELSEIVATAIADYYTFYAQNNGKDIVLPSATVKIAALAVQKAEEKIKENQNNDFEINFADGKDDSTEHYVIYFDGKTTGISTSDMFVAYVDGRPQLTDKKHAQFILCECLYHDDWMQEPPKNVLYKNADVRYIPYYDFCGYFSKLYK